MPRRAYTLVELFLVIFLGSIALAVALPFFRPGDVPSLAEGLKRLEAAKRTFASRNSLAPGVPVTLDALRAAGSLPTLPPPPDGLAFDPGSVGRPASLRLRTR